MILKRDQWIARSGHEFIVVGFYTVDTPYEAEVEPLKLSLQSLNYSYLFCGVKNLGSWQKNTQQKAKFIKTILEERVGAILYVDVDAIVIQPPIVLDEINCDIAAVHFKGGNELLSGTVYFNNTEACREVVDKWIALNEAYPETLPDGREAWDQRTLEMAIKSVKCAYVELPQEYTWIVELTQKHFPGLVPVILHTRGAKRFKNKINGETGYAT